MQLGKTAATLALSRIELRAQLLVDHQEIVVEPKLVVRSSSMKMVTAARR
jgi:DNA-binding LacI/PurR family transcriptional regulator